MIIKKRSLRSKIFVLSLLTCSLVSSIRPNDEQQIKNAQQPQQADLEKQVTEFVVKVSDSQLRKGIAIGTCLGLFNSFIFDQVCKVPFPSFLYPTEKHLAIFSDATVKSEFLYSRLREHGKMLLLYKKHLKTMTQAKNIGIATMAIVTILLAVYGGSSDSVEKQPQEQQAS